MYTKYMSNVFQDKLLLHEIRDKKGNGPPYLFGSYRFDWSCLLLLAYLNDF